MLEIGILGYGLLPRPLSDRLIVRRDEAPTHVGSIALPDSARGAVDLKAQTGIVLAIGPGVKATYRSAETGKLIMRGPTTVKVGDRVVFSRYTGGDLPGYPGCIMFRECDVLATIDHEAQAQAGDAQKRWGVGSTRRHDQEQAPR